MGGLSESEIVSKRIEGYLRALAVSLLRVDQLIAQETLQEIRLHLHTSATDLMAQGKSGKEAAQLAINRIGPIYRVGPRLSRELLRNTTHGKAALWSKRIVWFQIFIIICATGPSTFMSRHSMIWRVAAAIAAGLISGFLETFRDAHSDSLLMVEKYRHEIQSFHEQTPVRTNFSERLEHSFKSIFMRRMLRKLDNNEKGVTNFFARFGFWFFARIILVCVLLFMTAASQYVFSAGLLYIAIAIQTAAYKLLTPIRLRPS